MRFSFSLGKKILSFFADKVKLCLFESTTVHAVLAKIQVVLWQYRKWIFSNVVVKKIVKIKKPLKNLQGGLFNTSCSRNVFHPKDLIYDPVSCSSPEVQDFWFQRSGDTERCAYRLQWQLWKRGMKRACLLVRLQHLSGLHCNSRHSSTRKQCGWEIKVAGKVKG